MLRIQNIKTGILEEEDSIRQKILQKLRAKETDLIRYSIYKKSLDARKKDNLQYIYTVDAIVKQEKRFLTHKNKDIAVAEPYQYRLPQGNVYLDKPPVVVGFGPCGMFAALLLAQMGFCPIVLERGADVDARTKTVEAFWQTGAEGFSKESNVQFGEGGAGTFSDGKLTTRSKDSRSRKVLEELVVSGAPEEILYLAKPHIGTDKLKEIVKNIRSRIEALGGRIYFYSKLTKLEIKNQKIHAVIVNEEKRIETKTVILAIGHSARDTFRFLYDQGIPMAAKPFAVGARIEHPQRMIDESQYGMEAADRHILPPAEYLLKHACKNGRAAYTFCMCPGGMVVAAASEEGMLTTNGMSEYQRNQENANSALLVSVTPADFPNKHALGGVIFQRELEKRAFSAGGGNYFAPMQRMEDFLAGQASARIGHILPSYRPGVTPTSLTKIFPPYIIEAMQEAIPAMAKQLKGFDTPDAVLTAVESRSSSPVRILRQAETGESTGVYGLYPAGEGAGYAGGIVSAAIDGIRMAEVIFDKYRKS